MSSLSTGLHRALAAAALACCAAAGATAIVVTPQTIAYEPFDYPVGEQVWGQDGGEGWIGGWFERPGTAPPPPTSQFIAAGSLPGPTGLATAGNHAVFMGEPVFNQREVRRAFPEVVGADGTTTWISFLGQRIGETTDPFATIWPNNPYPRSANLSFFDQQAIANPIRAERIGLGNSTASPGNPEQYDEWSMIPEGLAPLRSGPATHLPKMSDLMWVVVRIDHFGDHTVPDRAWMWLNADPQAGEPLGANADVFIGNDGFNARDYSGIDYVRPFAGNADGIGGPFYRPAAAVAIDEIRIGTTWQGVGGVPEPGSLAMGIGAGVALAAASRPCRVSRRRAKRASTTSVDARQD